MRPNDDDNYVDPKQNRLLAVEMAAQAARSLARNETGGTGRNGS
jgi:hypothetical protein